MFCVGLLCLYTPLAQSGAFWLALSLTLLAGIFRYPEVSILLIELTLVGGLMTLVTHVLRRVFVEREFFRSNVGNIQLERSALTEVWPERASERQRFTESTTTMKTGGPTL